MKKFIVINTWNGDGYSSRNGDAIKIFNSKFAALRYAWTKVLEMKPGERPFQHYATDLNNNRLIGWGYDFEFDYGSYQVAELRPDVTAVRIDTNINEVHLLRDNQHSFQEAKTLRHFKNNYPLQGYAEVSDMLDDYAELNDNGDNYYATSCVGLDTDIQFRLLKNLF
jgi:hypothetical protein